MAAIPKHVVSRLLSIKWQRALRPRQLFAWDDDEADDSHSRRQTSTAWLDGARGVSALLVYIFHFTVNGYALVGWTYGSSSKTNHYHLSPLLRPVWTSGASSVCNFFIISGYALTVNSFLMIRQGRHDDLFRSLCSSVLRRWFRLWLPVFVCATPMVFVFQYWPYPGPYTPSRQASLTAEFAYFAKLMDDNVQPFAYMNKNGVTWWFEYCNQAWTIPLEFYCSMVCYLTVMLVSRIPVHRHRAAVIGFLAFWAMHHANFWTSLFLVGMLLADWDLEQQWSRQILPADAVPWQPNVAAATSSTDPKQNGPGTPRLSILRSTLNFIIFFIGYYLAGMPMQFPDEKPYVPKIGYEFLYRLQPPKWLFAIDFEVRWYQSLSACCLLYSTSQTPVLRRLLESHFCQWLGRLSFALYLTHAQLIHMISGHLRTVFHFLTGGREGLMPLLFVYEIVVTSAICFALAAFVWRHVDKPTVRFSRWLDETLTGRRRGAGGGHQNSLGLEMGGGLSQSHRSRDP